MSRLSGKHYWHGFSSTTRSVERISTTILAKHVSLHAPQHLHRLRRTASVVVRPPYGFLGS
jgi:hypothetical protein